MFTDPQVIQVNSVAKSLPRVESKGLSATYKTADDAYKLTIAHTPQRDRVRSMARIDFRAVVADPLTAVNDYETFSVYIVIDRPNYGFSLGTVQINVSSLTDWIQDSGVIGRLFGTES